MLLLHPSIDLYRRRDGDRQSGGGGGLGGKWGYRVVCRHGVICRKKLIVTRHQNSAHWHCRLAVKDIRGLVVCSETSNHTASFLSASGSVKAPRARQVDVRQLFVYIIHLQCTYSSSASAQRTLGGGVDLLPRARRGLGERMLQPEELSIKGPGGQ